MKYLNVLLIFFPLAMICRYFHYADSPVFVMACLSIVPMAIIIGDATEQVAVYTGPKIGGLLNATMGNVPELFIGFFAVKAGLFGLVLASMAGSIIGNLLLVLGFSVLCGGLVYTSQTFDKSMARSNFSLLCFAAISVVVPLAFKLTNRESLHLNDGLAAISLAMACIMLLIYILGLVFSLVTHRNMFLESDRIDCVEEPDWSLRKAVIVLGIATLAVAVASEMVVATVEKAGRDFGLPETFIGIVIIPIIGNVAEHSSAVLMSIKNKVDISLEIAVGSSMQIAMFVTPVLVLAGYALGKPMLLVYAPFEVVAIITAILLSLYVFQDGKTYWLEGVLLLFCYVLFGVAFFYAEI
ncbi:MAG: calcium/proton exchanger [Candidatus Methylumidiphilus sp.]